MDKIRKVLDKLEKYFHLDLGYYIKNSFYLFSAHVISTGMGLLLSIVFARFVSKELYGQYNYILSIIGILAIFTLPGMGTAIAQAVARGYDKTLITGLKERFKWSLLGNICIIGVGVYYFLNGFILLGKSFIVCSVIFPFYENFTVYNSFLTGKKRFDRIAKYQVIAQLFSVSAIILAIYLTGNLMVILIASLVSNCLIRGYFFSSVSKDITNQSNDPKAITFGKHLTLQSIPGVITSHGDKIIIGLVLSFPELAIYSIALAFSKIVRFTLGQITELSFPKLSEMKETEAYATVKKKYVYFMLLTVIVCGVAIILCPYIITFLYSQKYVDSILYARFLLIALIFGIPTTIFSKALFPSQRKIRELYKIQLFHTAIELPLLFAFIFSFGILGVVVAKILSNLFVMIYSWKLAM